MLRMFDIKRWYAFGEDVSFINYPLLLRTKPGYDRLIFRLIL